MEYLIRFSQSHETFRMPETQAIAESGGFDMKVLYYDLEVCSSFLTQAHPADQVA
jgi:tRNA (guanine10-N2)-methyltransferase